MRLLSKTYFEQLTKAAPLAVFRILFGLMMLVSIIRFWAKGWIKKLYLEPTFFFSYWGFEWVQPIGQWTYGLFAICGLSALLVAIGYKYRWAIIVFFLSFTYIELMDKTTYLNHYYFVSILSFLLIFLPANAYFSIDACQNEKVRSQFVPKWSMDSLKLILAIVYFYAGLAKLNSDWLVKAMPLKIWLPSKFDVPLLGDLLQQEWMHYGFSWAGAAYDLSIPFLLLWRKTRPFAFVAVVLFHVLTRVLFPIGMFPYIMIGSALIFFSANFHEKLLNGLRKLFRIRHLQYLGTKDFSGFTKRAKPVLFLFFAAQLLIPFRYWAYPDELFWTEEGYRFSWRVMLMEKAGYSIFKIVEPNSGDRFYVQNDEFLTPFQEKQMSFQPDFILEYAHYLRDHYASEGVVEPEVYVESYVALNGRRSRPFINPDTNLAAEKKSFKHKTWILPFDDEIKGL